MDKLKRLKPRKIPAQSRSAVTVDAIFEATTQVLRTEGSNRLSMNRVADRAGVSIGTMYQYFPHKRALLFSLLQNYLENLANKVEADCRHLHHKPLDVISNGLIDAHLKAITSDFEVSQAIFLAASEWDTIDFDGGAQLHMYAIIKSLLSSASDVRFPDIDTASFMLLHAFTGIMRASFVSEKYGTLPSLKMIKTELLLLSSAYLKATSQQI